ncbi:MAG: Ig-like domain-containing protein [Planctomycetota bacterium]|nr:Ig-like domain-containing protein [Planctomycetota bacterium]
MSNAAQRVEGGARLRHTLVVLALAVALCGMTSCGGGKGGPGPGGDGQGLVLLSFLQANVDNVALNTILQWRFSEPVNAATVTSASIQIREGPSFGRNVPGTFIVSGDVVTFEPRLASLCDLSDGAFDADTDYRVQLIGWPEEFAIQNTSGQKLDTTTTWQFHTRSETDPAKFTDQVAGTTPTVTGMTPSTGAEATDVGSAGNRQRIVVTLSENVDPCTVSSATVIVEVPEVGGTYGQSVPVPGGNLSGFVTGGADTSDRAPTDHYSWGSDTGSAWPGGVQRLPASVHLVQDFNQTQIVISPLHGQDPLQPELGGILPENALLVVRLTTNIADFGGQFLSPFIGSFTTQNLDNPPGQITIENEGETPYNESSTTADVNSARSPSLVQGFLLFAGDGDNGPILDQPSLPESDASGCTAPFQLNDTARDMFDPSGNINLDTGASNSCVNSTDGSTAVIWEFATLRVRSGVTVRIVGSNPAILLVSGDAVVEAGGRILGRGDQANGAPQGRGQAGASTTTSGSTGGTGVAGGGNGGSCLSGNGTSVPARYSGSGLQGYYMTGSNVNPSVGTDTGPGCGHGNSSVRWGAQTNPNNRNSPGGGGGGHASAGTDGQTLGSGSAPTTLDLAADGLGGGEYGNSNDTLRKAEAGSGGGAGGEIRPFTGNAGRGTGGAGGAGGGFLDITAGGDISIFGTIDVAGSPGGSGATQPFNPNYTWQPGTGGGGGGSGGGLRLLTPNDITLGPLAVVTAAGGPGGAGGQSQGNQPPVNAGGNGGLGRLVFEDGDSIISGYNSGAVVVPAEGESGFHRGVFDATRFSGGGLTPFATTEPFQVGPFDPTFAEPNQSHFVAGAPAITSPGVGGVVLLIEAQSYGMELDGTRELTGNGWRTIGYFTDSGIETAPDWNAGHPGSVTRAPDNVGNPGIDNMASLNGDEFVQFRFTVFLNPVGVGALDPGAYLDSWLIGYNSDN